MPARTLLVLFSGFLVTACAPEPDPAAAERLAELEAEAAKLASERDELTARLAACENCRAMNIEAFDAFGQSSAYPEALEDTVTDALALLELRVAARKPDEKLAIVLDIDETTLSNYPELDRSDYCHAKPAWNAWVETGKPTVIPGMDRLYAWALEHEIAVVFLTGRKEPQRAATERALREAGFSEWAKLIVRNESEYELAPADYKAGRRAELEREGYTVVLSLGDQESDLAGGHAEATLLMPNPFYFVR